MGSAPSAASAPYDVTAKDSLPKKEKSQRRDDAILAQVRLHSKVRVRKKRSLGKDIELPRMQPPSLAISCSSFVVIKWTPPLAEGWNFEYGVQMSVVAAKLSWKDLPVDTSKASRPSAFVRGLREGEFHVFRVRYRRRRLRSRKTARGIVPEWGSYSFFSPWSAPSEQFAGKFRPFNLFCNPYLKNDRQIPPDPLSRKRWLNSLGTLISKTVDEFLWIFI